MLKGLRTLTYLIGCVAVTAAAAADITFYQRDGLRGRSFTADAPIPNFNDLGFNDRASSLVIRSGSWQVCSDAYYRGRCVTLVPGDYQTLRSMELDNAVSSARPIGGRIDLFDLPGFGGQGFTLDSDTPNFDPLGINDRAGSAIVYEGTWQLCQHADFAGACITLAPGRHPDLGRMTGQASSARLVAGGDVGGPRGGGGPGGRSRAILFEGQNLTGRSFVMTNEVAANLGRTGFNDRASSVRVERGYWIFCSDAEFQGECRTFGPGDYPTLPWELNNRISSGRRISGNYPYSGNPNWNPR
jgi:hypothetical protein